MVPLKLIKNLYQKLKKRFRKVYVAKSNQEIIDKCNWIFLAVTPKVGEKILPKLNFRSNLKIISFISTINLVQLKKIVRKKAKIIRALPLPPISLRKGPVPICPPNVKVKNFFNHLGNNNFSTKQVKNFYYFPIGRWDLELLNNQVIKFPASKIPEAIQQSVELLARKDFGNYNIIDLRIHGKIVVE